MGVIMSCLQQVWDWLFYLWRYINQLPLCICYSSRGHTQTPNPTTASTISRLYGSKYKLFLKAQNLVSTFLDQCHGSQHFFFSGYSSHHHQEGDEDFHDIPIDDPNELNCAFERAASRQANETPLHPPIRLEVLPPDRGTFISRESLTSRYLSIRRV